MLSAIALNDASPAPVPAEQSFPGSTAAEWGDLEMSGLDPDGCFSPNLGCFLVRRNGLLVLCDAGIGRGPNAYLGGLSGHLIQSLALHGIAPDDISLVVFTHLHMDHIGWAAEVASSGVIAPTFPRARYVAPLVELDYWASDPQEARAHHREAFDASIRPLLAEGRMEGVAAGGGIEPGMRFIATPGHTPGHCSIAFEASGGTLVVAGDVFHAPGQVERPDWPHRADMDPDEARRTRRRFIAEAASGDWLLACGHFRDGLSFGRIEKVGPGCRFAPLAGEGGIIHLG